MMKDTHHLIQKLEQVWNASDCQPKNANGKSSCCDAECIVTLRNPNNGDIIESCSKCRDMIDSED
jgi:hypothetical protein